MKRLLIPSVAFLLGSALIASFYIGILTWAQGWEYAQSQFVRDRWYVLPIIVGFGIQVALYTALRFRHSGGDTAADGSGTRHVGGSDRPLRRPDPG